MIARGLSIMVAACLALGYALGYGVARAKYEKKEPALEVMSRFDPSLAPRSFAENCRDEGKQFIAWRGHEPEWRYACLSIWLRPEQILGL